MSRKKSLGYSIFFTLLIVVLFRVGSLFPVPFIDTNVLKLSMEAATGTLFGLFNMMSGGGLAAASIFAMGVSPYINASIIVQLLTVALPVLERLKKEGAEGQKKLNKLNRYVAMVLAIVQAAGFYFMIKQWGALSMQGTVPAVLIVLAFTTGSALVMWLGERITEYGVGNGISIVLVSGILAGLPAGILTLSGIRPAYLIPVILAVIFLAIILIVFMQEAERRIPVQYSRAVTVNGISNKNTSTLPIKVNMSGVMPIIFASTILSIPKTIELFVPSISSGEVGSKIMSFFETTSPVYGAIYFVLILCFNYFYVSIQYDPIEMSNNLKQQGGVIPGIRPGAPTTQYIKRSMSRITFIGGVFLAAIAVIPIFLNSSFQSANFYLGGTSLLIIVGVAIETYKQIESRQSVKKYKKLL